MSASAPRPAPLCSGRAAVWGLLLAQAVLFPLSIGGLYWFLLLGA